MAIEVPLHIWIFLNVEIVSHFHQILLSLSIHGKKKLQGGGKT